MRVVHESRLWVVVVSEAYNEKQAMLIKGHRINDGTDYVLSSYYETALGDPQGNCSHKAQQLQSTTFNNVLDSVMKDRQLQLTTECRQPACGHDVVNCISVGASEDDNDAHNLALSMATILDSQKILTSDLERKVARIKQVNKK